MVLFSLARASVLLSYIDQFPFPPSNRVDLMYEQSGDPFVVELETHAAYYFGMGRYGGDGCGGDAQ